MPTDDVSENVFLQKKTQEKDGYSAVQVGFDGGDDLSENDRRILNRILRLARQRQLARQGLKVEGAEE